MQGKQDDIEGTGNRNVPCPRCRKMMLLISKYPRERVHSAGRMNLTLFKYYRCEHCISFWTEMI